MRKNARLLLIDKNQVESLLFPEDVLAAVSDAFMLHSQGTGRVFPVVREKLSSGAIFGIKSGDIDTQGVLGFKAAGFWANNRALGGEPHQATIMLFDPATGRPRCVIDGNIVTTLRTGAAGGLGLLKCARQESTRCCVFGSGVQAQIQTRFALRVLPMLRTLCYVTANGQPDARFEAALAGDVAARGASLTHATDHDESVAASDVIITATPGGGALFSADAVQPGTHLNCVGADTKGKRELPEGLLARVRLFVDDRIQAREIGESQWAQEIPSTTLGDVLTGKVTLDRQFDDITVFDMTGIALQDLTVARLILQKAEAAEIGTRVDWPW